MNFKILTDKPLDEYIKNANESLLDKIDNIKKHDLPVDYFQFSKSVPFIP